MRARHHPPTSATTLLAVLVLSACAPATSLRVRTPMAAASSDRVISLNKLLSTCADAAMLGCEEIRRVQASRGGGGQLAVSRKVADDARSALTEADVAAQKVILSLLRAEWPGLRIVGEEDEDREETVTATAAAAEGQSASSPSPFVGDRCPAASTPELCAPLSAVTVFVDPLDGTREFVEGRLECVQSLVGVAVHGRATAGAIGMPFPAGDLSSPAACAYGLVGAGSGLIGHRPLPLPSARAAASAPVNSFVVATGDSKSTVLGEARAAALGEDGYSVLVGGAGHKMLGVRDGAFDATLMHVATCSWDTCAPEALLRASGGRLTDLFGAPLVYTYDSDCSHVNALGVVASAVGNDARHDALCRAMRANAHALALLHEWTRAPGAEAEGDGVAAEGGGAAAARGDVAAEAADLCRDLSGAPLSVLWLSERLGESGGALCGYDAPERYAFRGHMSNGCRLSFRWREGEGDGRGGRLSHAFYKRVVMGELAAAREKARSAPLKLARDVQSYAVEAAFLSWRGCARLIESGVPIARPLHIERRVVEGEPLECGFAMLMEEFSADDGWVQAGQLDAPAAAAALRSLARLHAFFWGGSTWQATDEAAVRELESAVWPAGGHWQPSMQPEEQWTQLAEKWETHYAALGAAFAEAPELAHIDLGQLGQRLATVAGAAAAAAHPFDPSAGGDAVAAMRYRTLIHGDTKAANLFIRGAARGDGQAQGRAAGPEVREVEVGLIDFQFAGFGLAAADVAHLMCAALDHYSCGLIGSGGAAAERAMLDGYHAALCEGLVSSGAACDVADAAARVFPRETLQAQYEWCTLDMCRVVFAHQWSRARLGEPSLNRNSYNKDLRSVRNGSALEPTTHPPRAHTACRSTAAPPPTRPRSMLAPTLPVSHSLHLDTTIALARSPHR